MIKNLVAKVLLGSFVRLYHSGCTANLAAKLLIEYPWKNVIINAFDVNVELDSNDRVCFWNANKFYAFMSQGYIVKNNRKIEWRDEMPDSYLMYLVKKKLEGWNRMKIRKDFVTNSSSSSYVIAICDDTTDKEIEEFVDAGIAKQIEDFPECAKERDAYIDFVKGALDNPSITMNGVNIKCGESYDDDISSIVANFPNTSKISAGVEYE